MWDEDSGSNLTESCGRFSYEIRLVDRSTGIVSVVPARGLDAGNGYIALQARDGFVLLSGQGDDAEMLVLNTKSGETSVLPGPPDTGGSAEAFFNACLGNQGGPFGVLTWSGNVPPSEEATGWAHTAVKDSDGMAMVVLVPDVEKHWSPTQSVHSTPNIATFAGVGGCGPAGLWRATASGGVLVSVEHGSAEEGVRWSV